MKKLTLTAMALALLATTPALAQTYRTRTHNVPMATEPYAAGRTGYHAYAAASEGYVVGRPGVQSYSRDAGWDPDPSIRLMLKRDATGIDAQ